MKKIAKNLFLGGENERPEKDESYIIISCAHETYDKELLKNSTFNNEKGYFLKNSRQIYFDFEDDSKANNINVSLVKKAITFIANNINFNKVYVHCLFGVNRSPSIIFIYCVASGILKGKNFKENF
jgi:protein-tyrosine phosphatase